MLEWQADSDGYRIKRKEGRRRESRRLSLTEEEAVPAAGLYIVANGGEPREYTANAWQEDILFDLANIAAYPFRGVEEEAALSDGVIAERVLAFAEHWGLLISHPEMRLSDFLQMADSMWTALVSAKVLRPIGGRQLARVTQEVDEQGRPYLLARAKNLFAFCGLEFREYAGIRGSYYCCANPTCSKFGPNPKVVNPKVGGRPRNYCTEACDKVAYRLRLKAKARQTAGLPRRRTRARGNP